MSDCDFPRDSEGRKTGEGCVTHNRPDLPAGVRCPDHPDYNKEHDMDRRNDTDAELGVITPEEVAATAPDEADGPGEYQIQPSTDPEEWPQDELADDEEDEDVAPNALTAFLVIIGPDGSAFATNDLSKVAEILPARQAEAADMRRGCQEVVHDVNAMQASQQAVALMQQSAQQLAEQARNEKIAAKLASKGIQVPRGRR